MLHLIPPPLHRVLLRIAHGVRRRWWRLRKPKLEGVAVIALDPTGAILLVRHSYDGGNWTFPGGGLRAGEPMEAAAMREFREELGCGIDALRHLGSFERTLFGAPCTTHVFAGAATGPLAPDGREVADARYFASDALPAGCSAAVRPCLAFLDKSPTRSS